MLEEKKFIPQETALYLKELLCGIAKEYIELIYTNDRACEISSLGIFTDSDISGFVFHHNTKERVDNVSGDKLNYKWWIPEWDDNTYTKHFSDTRHPKEMELHKIMSELKANTEWSYEHPEKFVMYKEEMFDIMCDSLYHIKSELGKVSEDFFMLVQECDNGIYGKRDASLAKILSESQMKEYIAFNKKYGYR